MPGYQSLRDAAHLRTRLRIAGLLLLIAVALLVFAIRIQTRPYMTSAPAQRLPQTYARMWFDVADDLVGAWWQSGRLMIERLPGTNPAASWQFDISPEDTENLLWTMAADSSRLVWISGATLHSQSTESRSKPVNINLGKHPPLALSLLSGGSVAVVFDNFSVGRWDAATGRSLGSWQPPIHAPDRAAAQGDYLAFSSIEDGSLRLFTFQGAQWTQVQKAISPELPDRIVLPAPSAAGTMMDGRVRIGGVTRGGPGKIRSVAAHFYDVIAAGDFDGIFVLPLEGEYYKLADAAPQSVVAAGATHLAVSNQRGTALFALGSENRFTPAGRTVSRTALGFGLAAMLMAAWPLLLEALAALLARKKRRDPRGRGVPGTLTEPPPELVNACASGRLILWAGAGLSAQSGFPTRARFFQTIVETAMIEFDEPALVRKIKSLRASGRLESALNELVSSEHARRGALISHFTAIFARFAPPSRSHDLLARLNLHSAITTNYDVLLEQTGDVWAQRIVDLGADRLDRRFLLKLYGSLRDPSTVLLSRAELQAALDRPSAASLRALFALQPFFFIGCSLEALLADLSMIGMPEVSMNPTDAQPHFVVAGVSGSWQKSVEKLWRRYGIQVLACAEEQIGESLPRFLRALADGAEQARRKTAGTSIAAKV